VDFSIISRTRLGFFIFPFSGLPWQLSIFGHLGIRFLNKSDTKTRERPDAPYVVPRFCRLLEPLMAGKPPRFEAKFDLWDVTFHYTTDMSVETLQYKPSRHTLGKIGPTQKLGTRPYTPLILPRSKSKPLTRTPPKLVCSSLREQVIPTRPGVCMT